MQNTKRVLLTGITGFISSHTAIALLKKGYHVTGTLRDIQRAASIRSVIARHVPVTDNLNFEVADLQDAAVWERITRNIDYIQHVASPFPKTMPRDENELIKPALNGNLNILKAASANGVKRVVITSSSAAIQYGKPAEKRKAVFDETDWTDENVDDDLTPYFKSKTIAEKAAWEFISNTRTNLELATVCPGLVLGPLLEKDFSASANVVIKMLDGSIPAVPRIGFEIVDVRSIAELLVLAMEKPAAANQRYAGTTGFMTMSDIAAVLKKEYPSMKIPSVKFPDWMVRLFSNFDATLKPVLVDLGTERKMNNSKAIKELGWSPLDAENAILSCADSVLGLGIVKKK